MVVNGTRIGSGQCKAGSHGRARALLIIQSDVHVSNTARMGLGLGLFSKEGSCMATPQIDSATLQTALSGLKMNERTNERTNKQRTK
jgi:hypothetical protein